MPKSPLLLFGSIVLLFLQVVPLTAEQLSETAKQQMADSLRRR